MMRFAMGQPARSASQAEIQRAIEDAQRAVQQAARDAQQATQDARQAARDAKAANASQGIPDVPDPPQPPTPPGAIVINRNDGEPITLSVDGQGIHVMQGGRETTIPINNVVPRGAVQMTYAVCATLAIVAVVGPLLRFFLRRHERRAVSAQLSAAVQARLDAMDRNIDTVAVELERVAEGQRFTAKLLEQRPLEHAQRIDR